MLKRVSVEEPIVFAGGVARNVCMLCLLEETLEKKITGPENPQMVDALGAALCVLCALGVEILQKCLHGL